VRGDEVFDTQHLLKHLGFLPFIPPDQTKGVNPRSRSLNTSTLPAGGAQRWGQCELFRSASNPAMDEFLLPRMN
jgi:hypothetical protein